jgi:CubicO group peptidase (beta-lactamase class C family)
MCWIRVSSWTSRLLLVGALLLPTPGAGQSDRFEDARKYIRKVMAERDLPSVSVAVARDGEVLWEQAFGWADRERRVRADPHTMYSLASISKPITATALMILAERGEIDLEHPVNHYLGVGQVRGLAASADQATVRRVLSHTSGLPLHYQFFYEDENQRPPSPDETISRYGIVTYPPGEQFQYSNIGYGVMDHVVSRVSGTSYGEFVRTEVLVPLGLTRTSVDIGPGLEAYAATRYGEDQRPLPFYITDHPGASALYSSAHDLVRFGMFHMGDDVETRPILGVDTRRRMQRLETPGASSDGYGLGWFVGDEFGFRKVWHTGSMPGVSTILALYPDEDVAIVVLMNTLATDLRYTISREIAAAVIPGYDEARSRAEAEEGSPTPVDTNDGGMLGRALSGRWEGVLKTWVGEQTLSLTVLESGDIHVELEGQLAVLLNDAAFGEDLLTGQFAGEIRTPDALRGPPHYVYLNLRLDGDRLYGQASARTYTGLTHYNLTSFLDLARVR